MVVTHKYYCHNCRSEHDLDLHCGVCGKYTGDLISNQKGFTEITISPAWRFWNVEKILIELPKNTKPNGEYFDSVYEMLSWKQNKIDEYRSNN